jgi:tetratricopeptide (TPR) repeat protein
MKEHMISSSPAEFVRNSSAQFHFSPQTGAAPGSPRRGLDGTTGRSENRWLNKVRESGTNFRMSHVARMLLSILLVGVFSVTALGATPAPPKINDDLREALESHNAGRLKEAVEIYTEILEKNPRSVEALNWRGMAYDDLGKLDEALADLNKAIHLSPKYADAYNNRGEVHRKKKMYPQALADYRKAASLDRKFAEPHYNIALVYESQKKDKQASREFQQYLALNPKAEDKKEIETKLKSLGQAKKVRKPRRPPSREARAAKPGKQVAEKPGKRPGKRPGTRSWKKQAPAKTSAAAVEVPGLGKIDAPPEAAAALATLAGLGIVALAIPLIIYIFFAVMLFLIAKKTGTSMPWLAFIPIAQLFLMVMIAGKPVWWFALLLLPVLSPLFGMLDAMVGMDGMVAMGLGGVAILVSMVAYLFICLGIASARGKSAIWGILMFLPCTQPIALGYLGLSK